MRRKGVKYDNKQKLPCPKCGFDTEETKELSMSSKWLGGSFIIISTHLNLFSLSPSLNYLLS